MASEELKGEFSEWNETGRKTNEVSLVYHVAHAGDAAQMVTGYDEDTCHVKVDFKVGKSTKGHNDILKIGECRLLFFSCPVLGNGWSGEGETNRYGNVSFELKLEDLVKSYKDQTEATTIYYYILGTSIYKQEHSHKVLVSCTDIIKKFPGLTKIDTDEIKPNKQHLHHVRGKWHMLTAICKKNGGYDFLSKN